MKRELEMVRAFHRRLGLWSEAGPVQVPPAEAAADCAANVVEEAVELAVALLGRTKGLDVAYRVLCEVEVKTLAKGQSDEPDAVAAIDGIVDTVYTALGAAARMHVADVTPYFDEVHRSNMTKESRAINDRGKRGGKGEGYKPPRLADLLFAEMMEPRGEPLDGAAFMDVIRHMERRS